MMTEVSAYLSAVWRTSGKIVVLATGCFDVLHPGHIQLLNQAKSLGDVLIVGINGDHSVKRLKGEGRPIHSECDRAETLMSLRPVDLVVHFDEDTPEKLVEAIRPHIFVKGGDYSKEDLPELEEVQRHGGRVEILPLKDGHSTTSIINKLS